MKIEIFSRQTMDPSLRAQIDQDAQLEFGHLPVIQSMTWSVPDWHAAVFHEDQALSFLSIVERTAFFDGMPVKLAGIANVITREAYRGKGLGSSLMKRAQDFALRDLRADGCLLLCSSDMIPFYSKLGWKRARGRLRMVQPSGDKYWEQETLIYAMNPSWSDCAEINLSGLPW